MISSNGPGSAPSILATRNAIAAISCTTEKSCCVGHGSFPDSLDVICVFNFLRLNTLFLRLNTLLLRLNTLFLRLNTSFLRLNTLIFILRTINCQVWINKFFLEPNGEHSPLPPPVSDRPSAGPHR